MRDGEWHLLRHERHVHVRQTVYVLPVCVSTFSHHKPSPSISIMQGRQPLAAHPVRRSDHMIWCRGTSGAAAAAAIRESVHACLLRARSPLLPRLLLPPSSPRQQLLQHPHPRIKVQIFDFSLLYNDGDVVVSGGMPACASRSLCLSPANSTSVCCSLSLSLSLRLKEKGGMAKESEREKDRMSK